jgi:hypothetical protein
MGSPPADFKSAAYTGFATQAWGQAYLHKKARQCRAFDLLLLKLKLEAEVGIEPAYADLQSAA